MTLISYIMLTMALSITAEIFCGSVGLLLPLPALFVFYFSAVENWPLGVLTGAVAGTVIDVLYARDFLYTPFLMALAASAGSFWISRSESKSIALHCLPGALIAAIYCAPLFFSALSASRFSFYSVFHAFSGIVFGIIISALALPLIVICMDLLGETMGFRLYRNARDKTQPLKG
ncbi:MAG: hypothetical protein A2017_12075 [Lentisphaerae bacterium GWF2_44_16]|nr:MAG: hypothetical protein A2017_12075 [Lentisphaerae bacterium GWF2_44_16]